MALTQEEAQALCQKWQRILRLQDWDVRVLTVPAYELDGDRGQVRRATPNKRLAVMQIVDPAELSPQADDPDQEVTIVHELLHLHFWEMTDPLESLGTAIGSMFGPLVDMAKRHHDQAEEKAVFHLAHVLVDLKRGVQEEVNGNG